MRTTDFLEEFTDALREQLVSDEKRWGDTWREVPIEGQEHRIYGRFMDYLDRFETLGDPVPWLRVAGNAMIAWIREKHPEVMRGDGEQGAEHAKSQ